jgi:flagella basal body P-ring formation protein FlgA
MVSFVHPLQRCCALPPAAARGVATACAARPAHRTGTDLAVWLHLVVLVLFTLLALAPRPLRAQAIDAAGMTRLQQQLQALTTGQITAPAQARIEVIAGQLDARLKLAPCNQIDPYLPSGARLWGSTRVGLRCSDGPVRWNVYLPVTVKVWAPALVATSALASGTELSPRDVTLAEVDIAASPASTFNQAANVVGRKLAVPLMPGSTLRADMLRQRQWFAAGDPVALVARGDGFSVSGSGEALGPGLEGQPVRVRTDSGRIVVGQPVGERRVEIRL